MNRRWRGLLMILSLAIAPALVSCGSPPEKVMLGVALTRHNLQGALLAVEQINRTGGIRGTRVELVGHDWSYRFEAERVLNWAERISQMQELIAVIGHDDSASTLSAAPLYNQKGIPHIVTVATHPSITNIGEWTYRLCPSDAFQGPALAEYAVRDWGKRRMAIYYVNDEYGRGLAALFEKRARELEAEIVLSVPHHNLLQPEDEGLIRASLQRLQKNNEIPDLVVLFQRPPAADWTLKTIGATGMKPDILGSDSLAVSPFYRSNLELKEGMRFVQFYLPVADNPRMAQFVKDFREFAQTDPDYGQAFAFDAVNLVVEAIRHKGYTREDIKDYLNRLIREEIPVSGATGTYTLAEDHDARRPIYIVEIRDGKQELVRQLSLD